ncbi:MAG TPA: hypothetical protein VGK73_11320 [Polyangiaceae bacterium]
MLHEAPNVDAKATHGFIGIESAERMRQSVTADEFKTKYPQEYARAVAAYVAFKRAEQEFKEARAAIASVSTPTKVGDIMDAALRESKAELDRPAHPHTDTIKSPTGVDSRVGTKKRTASVKAEDGSHQGLLQTEENVPSYKG